MADKESKLSIRQKQDFIYRMKERRKEKEDALTEDKSLNEGPLQWMKNQARKVVKKYRGNDVEKNNTGDLSDAKKSIAKETGKKGKMWTFYTADGTVISYDSFKKLDIDQQLACMVVDENGYFIRRGTEVFGWGEKKKAPMTLSGKLDVSDEEGKISDTHKGISTSIKGRPADWTYTFAEGDSTKDVGGEKLFDENGSLTIGADDIEKLISARDSEGNVIKGKDKIILYIKRYQARISDAQKKNDDAERPKSDGKGNKAVKMHIWNAKPKGVEDGKITTDQLPDSDSLHITPEAFKGLALYAKRACYFGVEYSNKDIKVFSYRQAIASAALKKAFHLVEGKQYDTADDTQSLTESYTVAKTEVSYDDDIDGVVMDTGYDFNYKIDDTFG